MGRAAARAAALLVLALPACNLFSGIDYPDRTRPVCRIATRAGIEHGATTELGILFLGRTAAEGPCRVHYFLGEQVLTTDGVIVPFGDVFHEARIDLDHQGVRIWPRPLTRGDEVVVMAMRGDSVVAVPVELAVGDGLSGPLLEDPGIDLPAGAGVFRRDPEDAERLWFAGLVAGRATFDGGRSLLVYADVERLAAALAIPAPDPAPTRVKHRADDIWLREEVVPETGRPAPETPRAPDVPGRISRAAPPADGTR